MWIFMAVGSALFAGLTSILAKCGIKKTDSDVATGIRTAVVFLFSWGMVVVAGSFDSIGMITKTSLLFLVLSGMATGASWICYFKALSMANVNKVVPIDKLSTILTVVLAIICFRETHHLVLKLCGILLLAAGVFLMIEKKDVANPENSEKRGWLFYAALSAVFAAATSLLAKVGITGVESNLGTAIRTVVVLIMAWGIILVKGKAKEVTKVTRKELVFLCLSGITTGASWLCYYFAIQNGVVSVVVPIDKLSILVTIVFSGVFLKEKLKKRAALGLLLLVCGTLLMTFSA